MEKRETAGRREGPGAWLTGERDEGGGERQLQRTRYVTRGRLPSAASPSTASRVEFLSRCSSYSWGKGLNF